MPAILPRLVRVLSAYVLLWLPSCATHSWPPPVAIQGQDGSSAQRLGNAVGLARAAAHGGRTNEALAGWLVVANESARLIEDKTACGDGSISRVKVTKAYQHALGQVLASCSSSEARGRLEIRVVQAGRLVRQTSLISVTPAPSVREYGGLRVGVPVDVAFSADSPVRVGRYVAVLVFPAPAGRPVLELRPTQAGGAMRLHPAGPLVPLREAAAF